VEEYDLVIKGGTIVDGTGSPAFKGSIGIKGDKISSVSSEELKGAEIIDATNLVVAPGFIDAHSHADKTLPIFPTADNYVMQGITTTVGGNCGNTIAPILEWWPPNIVWDLDIIYELSPYKYYFDGMFPADEVKKKIKERYNVEIGWGSFREFLDWLESRKISVNHVPLIGHNTIRAEVMGPEWKRDPTDQELEKMKELIREAMDAGAFGLSTGLDYQPGVFSKTEEIIELVKVVKAFGGIYATHWRRTGLRRERAKPITEKIKGIIEAVEISRRTGVPVQISHITLGYTIMPLPPPNLIEAAVEATLKVIDDARKQGIKVCFDVIPNTTGGTMTSIYLANALLPWLNVAGSRQGLAKALKMKDFRDELRSIITAGKWWGINPIVNPYWAQTIKVVVCKVQNWVGKTIDEIAKLESTDDLGALFMVLMKDPDTKIKRLGLRSDHEIATFLKHECCMVGLDTYAFDDKWEMKGPPFYLPHPNTFGGMARYFRRYFREMKVFSLVEAVRRVTSLPASVFGLNGRGVLKQGAYADIVVFNPDTISDIEDPLEPRRYPKGIHYVIVNGEIVVREGRHTGKRPGKVFRLSSKSKN